MSLFSLDVIPKSFVGIDIGTSALKIVEVAGWAERKTLKSYGILRVPSFHDKPFRSFEKNTLLLSTQDIARALRALLEEAHIETTKAIFSIADFSTFFTNFELPSSMKREELENAVRFEARRHVPLALSKITLDWQLLSSPDKTKPERPYQILLVAVPNEVMAQYQEIARLAKVEVVALEAEVFGSIRSCLKEEKGPVLLIEVGAQSTTISITQRGLLKGSHSVDLGGDEFTERIGAALLVDYRKAEEKKRTQGLHLSAGNTQILFPLVDMLLGEAQKVLETAQKNGSENIDKVVLAGGSARLPAFREYVEKVIKVKTEIANPFRHLAYPAALEHTLQEIGPSFAVAVGMALRGFE